MKGLRSVSVYQYGTDCSHMMRKGSFIHLDCWDGCNMFMQPFSCWLCKPFKLTTAFACVTVCIVVGCLDHR